MRDRLELDPDPTPTELEAVETALAEAHLLEPVSTERVLGWHPAGLMESVDRAPPAIQARFSGPGPRCAVPNRVTGNSAGDWRRMSRERPER